MLTLSRLKYISNINVDEHIRKYLLVQISYENLCPESITDKVLRRKIIE